MRVLAPNEPVATTQTPDTTAAATPPRRVTREVELTRTTATRAQMRDAIERAEQRLTGRTPSRALVDIVTAQACHETGNGRSMYNFNFGGIKGTSPSGMTAVSATHEWEGERRYRTQARFRAYESLDEGAEDFLSLLHRRYSAAITVADRGDVDAYAHALKQGGYFTGPEARYANDMRGLLGLPRRPIEETAPDATLDDASANANAAMLVARMSGSTGVPLPADLSLDPAASTEAAKFSSSSELALLIDAVSMSAARIASPGNDEG